MKAIRKFLTRRLLIGLLVLILAGNALLFIFIHFRMMSNLDDALEAKAHAFAEMTEQESEVITIELREEFMPEYGRRHNAEYYQVWTESGDVVSRSSSLKGINLPRKTGTFDSPVFWNLVLPDGRPGRAIGVSFLPFVDDENRSLIKDRKPIQIVLARDRTVITSMLKLLTAGIAAFVIITATGIISMVPRVIKSGLLPLRNLADYTNTIDSKSLGLRYNAVDLPDELQPIGNRLNELLDRIETAFLHEKRLTADMAHELKTPIAELRSMAEVALRWPDDKEFTANALREACAISHQMSKIVSVLLALGRCESGNQKVSPVSVDLTEMIVELLGQWQKAAAEKSINVISDLPDNADITTDQVMLASILSNLFSNAFEYCPNGGQIKCFLKPRSANLIFSIINSNASLADEDILHIFEHLWRKDAARSDSSHSGLGLPLAAAFADILGININAELLKTGDFSISLIMPYVLPGIK